MKKVISLILASCMLATCTACGGAKDTAPAVQAPASPAEPSSQSQPAPAAQSDKLVVYTAAAQDVIDIVVPEFEAQTGIKVELVTVGTGELLKRIESEKDNPLGDVEWGGVVSVLLPKADLFEAYSSPNESAQIESCKNAEGMITRNNIIPFCIMVNKNLIGDIEVKGYADLLKPELKGKIAFTDPAKSSTGLSHVINMLMAMGGGDEEKGWQYIEQFIANLDGKLLASSSAVPKGVSDGEYAVGLTHEELASAAIRDGAPVEIVYMEEGLLVSPGTVQIIKGAKNMDNAKKFVDFLSSKELQTLTSEKLNMRATRSDVPAPSGLPAIAELKILPEDVGASLANSQKWLDKFKDLYTN